MQQKTEPTDGGGSGAFLGPSTPVEHTPPHTRTIPAESKPKTKRAVEPAGPAQGLHDTLDGERLMSIPEVAGVLGVSVRTVYRLIAEQELPAPVRVRALVRMPATDLRAYLARVQSERDRTR
jgi:excisionase family DNA binding protein